MVLSDTRSHDRKPLPVPDSLSEQFWNGADLGRLVIQRCTSCRRYYHPPVSWCSPCGSEDFEYEAVSGRGHVYTFTVTRDARNAVFAALQPYVVTWVELDEQEGLRIIANMPSEDVNRVAIGSKVEVFFEEIAPGRRLPQFRLV